MFHRIDTRLRQIYGINKPFGGISVITVGDLNQLPPVMDKPKYKNPSNSILAELCLNTLCDEFKIYTLSKIMRQENDIPFINVLNNTAIGELTDEHCDLLNTRSNIPQEDIPYNAIRLFGENKLVNEYKMIRIQQEPGITYESISKDQILDKLSSEKKQKLLESLIYKKRQELNGLHHTLQLKIGIRYMMITNIDVSDGTLRRIDFNNKQEPITAWIDFGINKTIGRKTKLKFNKQNNNTNETSYVPIGKISPPLTNKSGLQISRTQFPLTPAEAITIHKSQGETYDKVCLDLRKLNKKYVTHSMMYVALSRVRKLEDIYLLGRFIPLPKKKNNNIQEIIKEMNTNRQLQISLSYDFPGNELKIIYHNVRSLKSNFSYIQNDDWYKQAHILILSETYTTSKNLYNLVNYTLIYESDINNKDSKGLSCYITININAEIYKTYKYHQYVNNTLQQIELIWIKFNKYNILTGYKSPRTYKQTFLDAISTFNLESQNFFIFIGDFNYDTFNENNVLENILTKYNLKRGIPLQLSTTNFDTQIDTIFISRDIADFESGTYESFFSDHKPIYIGLSKNNLTNFDKTITSTTEKIKNLEKTKLNKNKNTPFAKAITTSKKRKISYIDLKPDSNPNLSTINTLLNPNKCCYANTALQVLVHLRALKEEFSKFDNVNRSNETNTLLVFYRSYYSNE
ncbi:hypothetical protein TKK_0014650 [Trichogramma kaykai]